MTHYLFDFLVLLSLLFNDLLGFWRIQMLQLLLEFNQGHLLVSHSGCFGLLVSVSSIRTTMVIFVSGGEFLVIWRLVKVVISDSVVINFSYGTLNKFVWMQLIQILAMLSLVFLPACGGLLTDLTLPVWSVHSFIIIIDQIILRIRRRLIRR